MFMWTLHLGDLYLVGSWGVDELVHVRVDESQESHHRSVGLGPATQPLLASMSPRIKDRARRPFGPCSSMSQKTPPGLGWRILPQRVLLRKTSIQPGLQARVTSGRRRSKESGQSLILAPVGCVWLGRRQLGLFQTLPCFMNDFLCL